MKEQLFNPQTKPRKTYKKNKKSKETNEEESSDENTGVYT